jgi:2-methylcitrate dehydratase PrpD
LEGKFSTAYCAALGANGYAATAGDFSDQRLADPDLRAVVERVELKSDEGLDLTAARISARFGDGGSIDFETPLALGNPGNPMSWDDMREKFVALVEPVLGDKTEPLFAALRDFDGAGRLEDVLELVAAEPVA